MAKKKKAAKKTTTRRRRVSGIKTGDVDFMGIALVIGGAVASKIVNNQLAKSTNATMQKAAPYAGLLLGIVLPMLVKNNMVKSIGLGMAAGGGVTALGSTGLKVIAGLENSIAGLGYPQQRYLTLPERKRIAGPAGSQGMTKGTHSNFSGSRQSQMNTIAGFENMVSGTANGSGCGCN